MAYPPGPAMYPPPAVMNMQAPVMYNPVPGYEGLVPGASGGFLPPPPIQPMPVPDSLPAQDWSIPALTKEAAKQALTQHVDSNCCWSSGPATNGVITSMEQFNTYRYRLETYTEARKTEWASKPYEGQPVNGFTQPSPGPWQIPVNSPEMFKDSVQEVEVPYTSSVKPCDKCSATGRCACTICASSGTKVCQTCNATGKQSTGENCTMCNGTGQTMCNTCSGQGTKQCETCEGKRQILSYIKLIVEWKNNTEDFVAEQASGLKIEKLSGVSGKQLFKDTKYMVYPLMGFPDQRIVQASDRMVKDHQSKFSQSARILQQQQGVELIPITKVTYEWEGKSYMYFVYGNESKVKADDYPATCCCTIL